MLVDRRIRNAMATGFTSISLFPLYLMMRGNIKCIAVRVRLSRASSPFATLSHFAYKSAGDDSNPTSAGDVATVSRNSFFSMSKIWLSTHRGFEI